MTYCKKRLTDKELIERMTRTTGPMLTMMEDATENIMLEDSPKVRFWLHNDHLSRPRALRLTGLGSRQGRHSPTPLAQMARAG